VKKALFYITLLAILILTLFYFLGTKQDNTINTKINLDKKNKDPYGAFVFFESLKAFFPNSKHIINYSKPDDAQTFGTLDSNQLYIILRPNFYPNSTELNDLISFIDRGNHVFISTFRIDVPLEKFIKATSESETALYYPDGNYGTDTMQVSLSSPPFAGKLSYRYPGILMDGQFNTMSPSIAKEIGNSHLGKPNLIRLKKGKGSLYVHLSPLVFSNYFMLYDNNIQYFENLFSIFPSNTSVVIWDEFFTPYRNEPTKADWFNAIMSNTYFRSGILLALLLLLIYAVSEMRRKQRIIPIIPKPENASLNFVRTVGLLYYEKGDHLNLARKMSAHFLDHVRSRYKLFSRDLNQEFAKELSYKSGVQDRIVLEIVRQLNQLQTEGIVSETDLIILQKNMENFYHNE